MEPRYINNTSSDGNHRFGPSEIILPYPGEKQEGQDIYEHIEIILNTHLDLVEELTQDLCPEACPKADIVEYQGKGIFHAHLADITWKEDLEFESTLTVKLHVQFQEDGIHVFLPENAIVSYQHWTEALEEKAEQDSKLVIKNISREEFHSLYLRPEAFTVLEVAWFSDPLQKVIGTVAQDRFDHDWSYVVLGRDEHGIFRAIDFKISLPDQETATEQLREKIREHLSTGATVFPQGDDGPGW
jgi:hypothetical protein